MSTALLSRQEDSIRDGGMQGLLFPAGRTESLNRGNWYGKNYRLLSFWLQFWGDHPRFPPGVAVFDFDNTCIYGDVGRTVFHYQLEHLSLRIYPEHLADCLADGPETIAGKPFRAVTDRMLRLYEHLWPYLESNQRRKGFRQPEYNEFVTLTRWFWQAARTCRELGPGYILPLTASLLTGFSSNEVAMITRRALVKALAQPIASKASRCTCPDPIGTVEVVHQTGLRIHREFIDLMEYLQCHCEIRCCIVSASSEAVVRTAAAYLDFSVAPADVFGLRLPESGTWDAGARDYPLPYRHGKVRIIEEWIQADPVLVAGDAPTDLEMLNLPDVAIRILVNHNYPGQMAEWYEEPRFLLQGLDKSTGSFRPHSTTIPPGDGR